VKGFEISKKVKEEIDEGYRLKKHLRSLTDGYKNAERLRVKIEVKNCIFDSKNVN
jgi:hypothetical protein